MELSDKLKKMKAEIAKLASEADTVVMNIERKDHVLWKEINSEMFAVESSLKQTVRHIEETLQLIEI